MRALEFAFFISCFFVLYNYFGYAIIAGIIPKFSSKIKIKKSTNLPSISFVVAAYNEEEFIQEKILNTLSLNYPQELIEYVFVTDGSTDGTTAIIEQFSEITLMHKDEREGKSAAVNRAVVAANNDILIFSDANTILNEDAIFQIAQHYQDEKTGGVAGEKKVLSPGADAKNSGNEEGLYWKYESFLKKIDSRCYSVVGAAGELFSVRKKLYEPISNNIILDDFVISLRIAQKGYRIIYEPSAYAIENPSFSLQDEQKRKVRIAAGGFQAIVLLSGLFQFWKHFRLSFLYISHRVLRWAVSPFCLIIMLITSGILAFSLNGWLYKILFALQFLFYFSAWLASQYQNLRSKKIFKLPYYFSFMNWSVILGFFRYLKGSQSAVWEKARRSAFIAEEQ